jgi:DNA-directed RNA polymerase specialized sigma24 family protein
MPDSPTGRNKPIGDFFTQAEEAARYSEEQRRELLALGVKFGEGAMADTAVIEVEVIERHYPEIARILNMPEDTLRQLTKSAKLGLMYGRGKS